MKESCVIAMGNQQFAFALIFLLEREEKRKVFKLTQRDTKKVEKKEKEKRLTFEEKFSFDKVRSRLKKEGKEGSVDG